MKKILILIIVSFLLTGCFNSEKVENNWLENKKSTNEASENKIKCSKMNIDKDIKNNWWNFAEDYSIDEVFYSKNKNTCIWIVTLYEKETRDVWLYDILEKNWFSTKLLTNLWNCNFSDSDLKSICIEQQNKFDKEVRKLKE